ncbi:MAG: CDP-alcohol phosphatidyltransferase family protein [Alphaproteobacteria bacterium]|nr:CDP-alcohol phosphatidyltransferase family protein [Alphaproteobacteria bacterium]
MTRQNFNLPNFLTGLRVLAAPLVALMLLEGHDAAALLLFAAAGLSDAADGWLAKQFGWTTPLGRLLDPAADKLLMLFAFGTLAVVGAVPLWLAAVVIGRDGLLILGFGLAWTLGRPFAIEPSAIGKASTVLQVVFVAVTLAALSLGLNWPFGRTALMAGVAALTVGSGCLYAVRGLQALACWARAT